MSRAAVVNRTCNGSPVPFEQVYETYAMLTEAAAAQSPRNVRLDAGRPLGGSRLRVEGAHVNSMTLAPHLRTPPVAELDDRRHVVATVALS